MQNKKRGLSLDRDPLTADNGPFGRVRLDIPALIEFPLYPVPAFVPDLHGFRIVRRLAIMADLF